MRIYHGPRTTECFDNSHFVALICALHRNRGQHVVGGDVWAETAFTYANSEWQDSAQIQAKHSTGRRLEPRNPLASSREFRRCGTRRSCRRELEIVMVDRTVLWPAILTVANGGRCRIAKLLQRPNTRSASGTFVPHRFIPTALLNDMFGMVNGGGRKISRRGGRTVYHSEGLDAR